MKQLFWKRMTLIFITFFILQALAITSVSAETDKQRIFDEAGLLEKADLELLENIALNTSNEHKTDFIILTTENGYSAQELKKYVQDMYDENGYGYDKTHGNAAIMAVDSSSREVYIEGFYHAEDRLTNERVELVLDKIVGDLGVESYYQAFLGFIDESSRYMQYKPGANPDSLFLKVQFHFIVSLLLGAGIVWFMAYNSGGKVTTNARTYRDEQNTRVLDARDVYLRTTVTKVRKPQNNSSSGGGGGGRTGGGHSHSGGGRSF